MLKISPQLPDQNISGITRAWKNPERIFLIRPGTVSQWPRDSPSTWRGAGSVQYVQYCLATASFLTRVSCTRGLAAGGPGPQRIVWVEFSTRCLPSPRGVLPDLQTPIRIHSFLDGKYSSCCCQRTLIFDCKPGRMSVGQTRVSRSQVFLYEGRVCSGWYLS